MAGYSGRGSGIVTALIYTRVSSDEQARDGVSLDAQLAECRRYAAGMPGWALGDEYQDVLSGTRDDRRDYQRLLADVRRLRAEGRRVVVVVAALDRFGRKLLERVRSREELKALGVPTHSVREGGEVSDIVANVLAAVAEEEVRRLGERVRATNRHLAAGGWHHPGRPLWGYTWRPSTADERAAGAPKAVPIPDESAAPYVREAFRRLADGASLRSVANWIARLPEQARAGRAMRYSSVYVILQSQTFIGQHPDGSAGRWPALIDEETWQRAQDAIAAHKHLPKQASRKYLLTGFLRCEKCGARMSGWTQRCRPTSHYRCTGQQQGAASPDIRCYYHLRCDSVDRLVLDEVAELIEMLTSREPRLQAELRERWKAHQRPATDDATAALHGLEQAAEQARRRLTNAAVFLVDGTIDKAGYERLRDKEQADLNAAEAEIARLTGVVEARPTLPPLDAVLAAAGGWRRMLEESDTAARREVLAHLIQTITPHRLRREHFTVEITWTPLGETLRRMAGRKAA